MATATKKATGFPLPCPHCGDVETGLKVRVNTLAVECGSCDEEVTRADLERMIAEARRFIAWLDLAETV